MSITAYAVIKKETEYNKDGHNHTLYFIAHTTANETIPQIEWSGQVPMYGSLHPNDYTCYCDSIKTSRKDNSFDTYDVVCHYIPIPQDDNNKPQKPETPPEGTNDRRYWNPDISVDWQEVDELVQKDLDGKPVVSCTGEPIVEYRKQKRKVVVISAWDWKLRDSQIDAYNNTLNNTSWWSKPAGTWKLTITAVSDYEIVQTLGSSGYSGVSGYSGFSGFNTKWTYPWFKKTYRFEHNPEGWQPQPLDTGYYRIVQTGIAPLTYGLQRISDDKGNPLTHRSFLNNTVGTIEAGYGQPIPTPAPPNDPVPLKVKAPFKFYETTNFSTLFTGATFIYDITTL